MASDSSIQFREPASHTHVSDVLHPSSNIDGSTVKSTGSVEPKRNSASTKSSSPLDRQSSMGKVAAIAKHIVKSPAEEIEHKQLEKTLSKEAKKGEVDVSVMEA